MRLGIDIDGVLYDWSGAVRDILVDERELPEPLTEAQKLQLQYPPPQWNHVEEVVGEKNWNWLWQSANTTRMFLRGDTYLPSMDALTTLSKEHEVYLITSRPKEAWWQTYEWLGRKTTADIKGVIHEKNKAKVAGQLGLRVVVDDNPDMLRGFLLKAKGAQLRGLYVYGLRQPWNRDFRSSYYRFRWIDDLTELLGQEWSE